MLKQDHKEKDSEELLSDLAEREGLTFDEAPEAGETLLDEEAAAADDGETALTVADDETELAAEEEAPEAENDLGPMHDRVFGMPRVVFWGIAGGIGVGYILTGLLIMIGLVTEKAQWPVTIACAVVGYFLTNRFHKKRVAEAEAAKQQDGQ